jgi:hypothetical protein
MCAPLFCPLLSTYLYQFLLALRCFVGAVGSPPCLATAMPTLPHYLTDLVLYQLVEAVQ